MMVHLSRIELASPGYQPSALPLSYRWMMASPARVERASSGLGGQRPSVGLRGHWVDRRELNSLTRGPQPRRYPFAFDQHDGRDGKNRTCELVFPKHAPYH
jgi:hypothetical protein